MPPRPTKRQRLSDDDENASNGSAVSDTDVEGFATDDDLSSNDDEEIANLKPQKSSQTKKRKIRATAPEKFGATLQFLLNTEVPSTQPLSLKPALARQRNDEKLEVRAKRALAQEKKDREDKGRIVDVIGGWGNESERALRKVAQRGVVKLFNVIQQSQAAAEHADEDKKASRGSGKPSLPAPTIDAKGKKKGKNRDNIIGRGKEVTVGKDDFFDMIRSGGVVSKV